MKTIIKRIRYKPGERYPFSFYAEYPYFTAGDDADQPSAAEDSSQTVSTPEKASAKPGKKQKQKRIKKVKTPASAADRLNKAVERLVEAAAEAAASGKTAPETVNVSHYVYHCDDRFISFALDVQRRAGPSLVYLRRFCFNWDCAAGALVPLSSVTRYHRRLTRENGGARDYNISPGTLFMQRNSFTREAGQNCRRSQYRKFLTAAPYDLRALRGGEKRGEDIIRIPAAAAENIS